MSKYTITIRNIEEIIGHEKLKNFFMDYNLTDFLTNEEVETITSKNTWSKEKLAEKIIEHYYFDEIGFETIEMFRRRTKILLQEIMESKLPLIYSNSVKYDMLVNVDFTETFDRNIDATGENKSSSSTIGSNNSTSDSSGESKSKYSDTPQNLIQNLSDEIYVSNATFSNTGSQIRDNTQTSANSSNESSGKSNNIEHYERKQKGNSGALTTSQKLIEQYRSIIVSIDRDIIKELSELFMRNFLN